MALAISLASGRLMSWRNWADCLVGCGGCCWVFWSPIECLRFDDELLSLVLLFRDPSESEMDPSFRELSCPVT